MYHNWFCVWQLYEYRDQNQKQETLFLYVEKSKSIMLKQRISANNNWIW